MANALLGFLAGHLIMNVYSAVTGNLPSSIVPGVKFTSAINTFELAVGLILISILILYLFLKEKTPQSQFKNFSRILNGALVFGALFAFSETNWLLSGVCLVLAFFFFYINFFRLKM